MTETAAPPHTAADPLAGLVRRHQHGVWRFLRLLGCRPADAEELAADAFVVAHQKGFVARSDAETAAFLRQTARFLWLRRQRRDRRDAERFAAAAELLWQRQCAADEGEAFVQALRECVAQLDGRPAEAVRLCYGDGLPQSEAAARLGLLPNGLKTLLQRLRAALRRCIERRLS